MKTPAESQRLGQVTLVPSEPVVAGSIGEWTLTYRAGSLGVDEGGTIKLSQRFASDWEVPQFDRPTDPGYTTVHTTGHAKLSVRYDRKAHERPWMKCVVIDVYDGHLDPDDTVTIVLGDQSKGSPGIRAQTFQESAHEFRVFVDPTNASLARHVPECPTFPVVAGKTERLVCFVRSNGIVGEPLPVFVRGRDAWNNPTSTPIDLRFQWVGEAGLCEKEATFAGNVLTLQKPDCGHVMVYNDEHTTRSNPIQITDQPPRLCHYWGDLHAQSDATVGTGTEIEYFTFARDEANLDFTSHQGNDFQMTDADWERLNVTVDQFHQDHHFVVFPGYEWSANTSAGGDRNVFYLETGLPIIRSSHWQVAEVPEDELTPAYPADVFFDRIASNVASDKVLLGSHVGGRYADIVRYFDQQLGPLVEVVSCWGVFEWMLWDALKMGYVVGVMCNSDGHKGRPGDEAPGAGAFGIRNGLTCVLAESLTRDAIFQALKQRRCYGTTGPRIDLQLDVNGKPMGSCLSISGNASLKASVRGTAPIDSLSLYQGSEIMQTVRPAPFETCGNSTRIRVVWGGARMRGRGRRAIWDGQIELKGTTIQSASTFAFDSPIDGILSQDTQKVRFRSRTTGDIDGIDLWLDQAASGTIRFQSEIGTLEVDLSTLGHQEQKADFGGLDLRVTICRYPMELNECELSLQKTLSPCLADQTAFYVKAIQSDGHAAWSSPIYISWNSEKGSDQDDL